MASEPVAIPPAKEQTAASTGVSFPVTESPTTSPTASFEQPSSTGLRPPHLPFRRISLPTVPSLQPTNRLSVASAASIDIGVVLEEPPPSAPPTVTTTPIPPLPLTPNKNPGRRTRTTSRPISVDNKRGKRSELKTVDESKEDKRRKVIEEFYETERTYVHGLDLIYSQFLEPIIASLDTPSPLLERSELTAVFSNFIDIWNLHRAFFSSLTEHLRPFLNSTASSPGSRDPPPPMSPLLLSHFPYLSLYTPFVTSFHTSVLALTQLLTGNAAFSTFVAKQEADPICGKLKLRDWLLTIVQRCPRYLLLLKDLIGCTDPDDLEAQSLAAVHTLVSKITSSLNTSLHTHAQTLQLLALQRATPNLPFQLITPGRTFLKRGQLSHQTRGALLRPREFLLFSDCLLWLESVDAEAGAWDGVLTPPKLHLGASSKPGASPSKVSGGGQVSRLSRPRMLRSRSRSEAELGLKASTSLSQTSTPKRQASSSNGEERWNFRGRAELVDLEVVVPPAVEEDDCMRFEVLSPEESFAVYAESEDERAAWVTAIRNAKAALFVTLNATHPNSTLTSSSSTHHLRRALQALPHLPEDDGRRPKRGRVEHFVPAVWIPDAKTDGCMRCAKPFGWRRRRHHCRLCGRCVCSSCSGSTFFIADAMTQNSKPARACNSCYETVFPVMTSTTEIPPALSPSTAPTLTLSSFQQPQMMTPGPQRSRPASVLMALDAKRTSRFEDAAGTLEDALAVEHASDVPVVRIKAAPRSRSYHQIFQDFGGAQSAASLLSAESVDSLADAALQSETEGSVGSGFRRIEDTERRKKRFSLPAVALQTTSVMAHAAAAGTGRAKRFSLVLGGGGRVRAAKSGSAESVGLGVGAGGPGGAGDIDPDATVKPSPSQIRGPAALSLTELLGRDNRAAVGA